MKALLMLVAVLAVAGRASAAVTVDPCFLTAGVSEALLKINRAFPEWRYVSVRVAAAKDSYTLSDLSLRLNVTGRKTGENRFSFHGFLGNGFFDASAAPIDDKNPAKGFAIRGMDTNVSVRPSGTDYRVSGFVNRRNFSLFFIPTDDGYAIQGIGVSGLVASKFENGYFLDGDVDARQMSASDVASLGAVLAVLHATTPR